MRIASVALWFSSIRVVAFEFPEVVVVEIVVLCDWIDRDEAFFVVCTEC